MPFQTVLDAWIKSGKIYDVQRPATEGGIQAAEAQIGAQLPVSLREVYQVFNGGWAFELKFFPLFSAARTLRVDQFQMRGILNMSGVFPKRFACLLTWAERKFLASGYLQQAIQFIATRLSK